MTGRRPPVTTRSGRWHPRRIARIFEAAGELTRAEVTVRRAGGAKWRAALGVSVDPDEALLEPAGDAVPVRDALTTATRRSPVGHRCLVEAVAATRMLHRRGFPARTYIGGARDPEGGPVELHAWVVSGLVCVTGGAERDRYQPVTAYDRPAGGRGRSWRRSG